MHGFSLTFVDDNEAEHFLIQEAVGDLAVPVRSQHFLHADQFLESLERGEVTQDAVITDLNMPGRNGFELIHALRARREWLHLPVLILTTSAAEVDRARAADLDADGYFVKPLTQAALVEQLGAMLQVIRGRMTPPSPLP